jgi:hypothetical protein
MDHQVGVFAVTAMMVHAKNVPKGFISKIHCVTLLARHRQTVMTLTALVKLRKFRKSAMALRIAPRSAF